MDYEVGLLGVVASGASWNSLLRALLPEHLLNSTALQSLVITIPLELGLSLFLARDNKGYTHNDSTTIPPRNKSCPELVLIVTELQARKEFPSAPTIFTVLLSECDKQHLLFHADTIRVCSESNHRGDKRPSPSSKSQRYPNNC